MRRRQRRPLQIFVEGEIEYMSWYIPKNHSVMRVNGRPVSELRPDGLTHAEFAALEAARIAEEAQAEANAGESTDAGPEEPTSKEPRGTR
jgi:hypothetical protein